MNGCNYSVSLHEVGDCLIHRPSSLVGPSVTLDLCADDRYSLQSDICRSGEVTSLPVNFSNNTIRFGRKCCALLYMCLVCINLTIHIVMQAICI